MANKALTPIEQKQVVFYDDEITAVLVQVDNEEKVYVPVKPVCDFLGVSWSGQRRRINRDAVLSAEIRSVNVTFTEPTRTRHISTLCLPLDYISGFLFGINPERTKPEIKEKLIRYQRECYKVLSEAFLEGRLTADTRFDDLLDSNSGAVQAYRMATAIMKMARQQILIEAQLETYDARLSEHENRLELIEGQLGASDSLVTPEQSMQISQAVKTVAYELGKRSKRNEYGGVYGELYRRYGINSYKALPKSKFDDALNWLNDWLQSLISDVPF